MTKPQAVLTIYLATATCGLGALLLHQVDSIGAIIGPAAGRLHVAAGRGAGKHGKERRAGAGSRERGAGSGGAGSGEQGAGSRERGAGSRERGESEIKHLKSAES